MGPCILSAAHVPALARPMQKQHSGSASPPSDHRRRMIDVIAARDRQSHLAFEASGVPWPARDTPTRTEASAPPAGAIYIPGPLSILSRAFSKLGNFRFPLMLRSIAWKSSADRSLRPRPVAATSTASSTFVPDDRRRSLHAHQPLQPPRRQKQPVLGCGVCDVGLACQRSASSAGTPDHVKSRL